MKTFRPLSPKEQEELKNKELNYQVHLQRKVDEKDIVLYKLIQQHTM